MTYYCESCMEPTAGERRVRCAGCNRLLCHGCLPRDLGETSCCDCIDAPVRKVGPRVTVPAVSIAPEPAPDTSAEDLRNTTMAAAGFDPKRRLCDLSRDELATLRAHMRSH